MVGKFVESRLLPESLPGFEIVVGAITPIRPAFLIMTTRIRAEQNAAWFEGCVQFQEHAAQNRQIR